METPVRPRLVLVCGVPGAGKTTLARGLGAALHLPVVVRDDVKTGYADTHPGLDWTDPDVRREHGGRTFDAFHAIVDAHLDAGCGVVAEAAWHWRFAATNLVPRMERSRCTLVTVEVPHAVSAARYRARFERGERHRSHHDAAFADQMDGPGYDVEPYRPPDELPARRVTVDGALAAPAVLAAALAAVTAP